MFADGVDCCDEGGAAGTEFARCDNAVHGAVHITQSQICASRHPATGELPAEVTVAWCAGGVLANMQALIRKRTRPREARLKRWPLAP
jgi:hypothetical protein